jgi:hypothetical protein
MAIRRQKSKTLIAARRGADPTPCRRGADLTDLYPLAEHCTRPPGAKVVPIRRANPEP